MKMILFASALALGSAAFAQDTMPAPTAPPADQPAPAPDASPPPAAAAPAETPTPSAPAASSTTDVTNLPTCSRTVTDKCVQKGSSGHATKQHAAKKKAPK